MDNWRNRPTCIENWPENVDYLMFIDENGNADIDKIGKKILNFEEIKNDDRYFTITGCIVKKSDYPSIRTDMLKLKETYWEDGKFLYKEKNGRHKLKRVCFHSREIKRHEGPFSFDGNDAKYEGFINDLSSYISNIPMTILSSSVNKYELWYKYICPYHPYNLCLDFILERFSRYILKSGQTGAIVIEARGKREDRQILDHIKSTLDNGTNYVSSACFKNIKGVYFNPKWCKASDEQQSYVGLEIADLCSYPIHKYVKHGTSDLSFNIIKSKIYNYPFFNGFGMKIFPL